MDLLIPNMFLTLYLGLNMHHLHCRAVTSLSELYRPAGNAFPMPHCSPCQMWSCEDKAVRRSLDAIRLSGGVPAYSHLCSGQAGSTWMDPIPRTRSPLSSVQEELIFPVTDAKQWLLSPAKPCLCRQQRMGLGRTRGSWNPLSRPKSSSLGSPCPRVSLLLFVPAPAPSP